MDDLLEGSSAGDVARGPGEKVPAGHYPKLRLLKCEVFKAQTGRKARCFKATSEVVEAANGKQVGDRVEQFCQLEFNTHDYYDKDSRAQVMQFLGALFGYGSIGEIDANISTQTLLDVTGPGQPKTGTVFAADVSYKKPDSPFAKWLCRPVAKNGAASVPAFTIPDGWKPHPADPRYIYNVAVPSEMRLIP
jgi:hypothetical protein